MTGPKISVIVPVYNVEPYLRKCLDSIVGQTYRNLEIILVDDGSTDGSGAICEEYAEKDARVRTFHQKNFGVSSARNRGLAAATGEFIGWVDSDDWIEPDMYEYLLKHQQREQSDITVCGRWEEYPYRSLQRGWAQERVLNKEQALKQLLENDVMQNFLWDRLWKRELFADQRFPEGRTYEDIAVMHRLFLRAEEVLCLPEAKYHYRQRVGSIVGDTSLENRIDHFLAAKQRYDEIGAQWPQFENLMLGQCVASAIGIWRGYYRNPEPVRKQMLPQLKDISKFAAQHYQAALRDMSPGKAGKILIRLTPYPEWWSFLLSCVIGRLYEFKHGRAL